MKKEFIITVTGDVGTGKSKLLKEIVGKCSDTFVFIETNQEHQLVAKLRKDHEKGIK